MGIYKLSKTEHKVYSLLIEGFKNKDIADKLNVSYSAIAIHNKHIYQKMNVDGARALIASHYRGRAEAARQRLLIKNPPPLPRGLHENRI